MADLVLALNAGSSTIKFALFSVDDAGPEAKFRGLIEDRMGQPKMRAWAADGRLVDEGEWPSDAGRDAGFWARIVLEWAEARIGGDRLCAVSHRVVHGGPDYAEPVLVTDAVLSALDALSPLAPLHQPDNLAMVRAVMATRPALHNVACFDTAFFRDLPPVAQRAPIPRAWADKGVRRYGFHGLSYAYLQRRLQELKPREEPKRVIFAHLGSGASLCGCLDGAPIDTTMGFSPLDGLVMSTRCGALDPGIALYLQRTGGLDVEALEHMLYRQSGLLGVSGLSGDMRVLQQSQAVEAREAVDLFVYRLVQQVGALTASLGGLDALVFSGGIGEHAAEIRRRVCEALEWLGLQLDEAANAAGQTDISTPQSLVSAMIIPTDEEDSLASGAFAALGPDFALRGLETSRIAV